MTDPGTGVAATRGLLRWRVLAAGLLLVAVVTWVTLARADEVVRGDPASDYAAMLVHARSVGRAAKASLEAGGLEASAATDLRQALELAIAWANRGDDYRRTAPDAQLTPMVLAMWLGVLRFQYLRFCGASPEQVLEELEPIPLDLAARNAVTLLVVRADCLRELGRLAAAERLLDGPSATVVAGLSEADRVQLSCCRADVDLRLGNHDEAVRRLAPWLAVFADLEPQAALQVGRTYAEFLMATERFDEVEPWVESVRRVGGAAIDRMTEQSLRLQVAIAAVAAPRSGEADAEVAAAAVAAAVAALEDLAVTADAPLTRRWASIYAARAALAGGDTERARRLCVEIDEPGRNGDLAEQCRVAIEAEVWLSSSNADSEGHALELARHRDRLDVAWQALRGEWRSAPDRSAGVGFLHFAFRRDVLALRVAFALLAEAGDAGRESALAVLVDGLAGPGVTPALVRQRLLAGERQGLLVYWPAGPFSHVFAVDRHGLVYARLDGTQALHRAAADVANAIERALVLDAAAPAADANAALQRLDSSALELREQVLPEPILSRLLAWSKVSVLGTEMLLRAPLECLPIGKDLLGQVIAVDHLPSLAFALERTEQAARTEDLRLTVLGHLATADGHGGLQAVHLEEMCRGFPRRRVAYHLEDECTLAAFAGMAATDVLVLLLHGVRVPGSVRPWGLALHDGVVDCSAIERSGVARAAFVVLAACHAGRGPNRFGAELRADLGGACLAAGARSIASSPFALRLGPTRRLLEHALPLLQSGHSPAEAWRQARAALRGAVHPLDERTTAAMAIVGCGQTALR